MGFRLNKILLDTNESEQCRHTESSINVKTVATFYQIADLYKLNCLLKTTFSYFERCFTMVVDSQNFLHLTYNLVDKIVKSSQLKIDSEIEVFNAIDSWTSFNINERRELAKNLLSNVRFHLFSENALKDVIKTSSSFSDIKDLKALTKEVSGNNDSLCKKSTSTHRYCSQEKFDIVFCGVFQESFMKLDLKVDKKIPKNVKFVQTMTRKPRFFQALCMKGDIYVLAGSCLSQKTTVEKYFPKTETWKKVAEIDYDNDSCFCACAFAGKVYIFGGSKWLRATDSCVELDFEGRCKWTKLAGMGEARRSAACAVYEGGIVVCGGDEGEEGPEHDTVERYDVTTDRWTPLPRMTTEKSDHGAAVIGRNYYVISRWDGCEVYDGGCFTALKGPNWELGRGDAKVVTVGRAIVAFHRKSSFVYDVDEGEWTGEEFEVDCTLLRASCLSVPKF